MFVPQRAPPALVERDQCIEHLALDRAAADGPDHRAVVGEHQFLPRCRGSRPVPGNHRGEDTRHAGA